MDLHQCIRKEISEVSLSYLFGVRKRDEFSLKRLFHFPESAKLRTLRPRVPTYLACLRVHVPTCLAYLRAHVPTCLVCLLTHVPTCLACLRAHVPTCLACLSVHVPSCLTCLRAHVSTCLAWSRAHVPMCLTCLRAHIITCSCLVCSRINVPCVLCVPTCSRVNFSLNYNIRGYGNDIVTNCYS